MSRFFNLQLGRKNTTKESVLDVSTKKYWIHKSSQVVLQQENKTNMHAL